MAQTPYAELHCHTNFSFLDGASAPDDLVERAVELGLTGLAVTDHAGLYGAVRFVTAAEAVGLHPVVGLEIELLDPAVPDPDGIVVPPRRARRRGSAGPKGWARASIDPAAPGPPGDQPLPDATEGLPARPRPSHTRLPGHRDPVKEDLRGIGERIRGPHLVLLARSQVGWRSLCRLVSHANMAGTKAVPRFSQALLAEHTDGLVALSGCRDGELVRRLRAGDRAGARAVAERYATLFGRGDGPATQRLLHRAVAPPAARRRLARVGSGGAGRGARPPGRRHQRRPLRPPRGSRAGRRPGRHPPRPDARHARRPAPAGRRVVPQVGCGAGRAGGGATRHRRRGEPGRRGSSTAVELAASCSIDLGFEQYRFPGFPVPGGETPFSYLSELCWAGARKRYHPVTSAGRQAARPRARGHRASRPRRVLPHLLGPHALREGAGDPGPGSGQRDQLDRVVHARDQPGRADRPQPPVRAVHQSGPDDLPGRRHRLQLGAARGGHPVRLRPLRPRAHGDGLQPRHVPGAVGGARGGLRARVPAAARRSGREGARDVRLGHGPARPRGRRRVRRVLPAAGRGAAGRGIAAHRRGRGRRGAWLRRRDGPAEHAGAARREGAALAPATEAGGPERTATVRLAPGGRPGPPSGRPAGRRGSGMWEGAPESPPSIRPGADRRRGRSGRHAGQRRLAAGGPRDRLRGGRGSAASRRRSSMAGGSTPRAASSSRRRARRTGGATRARDRQARTSDPLGSAGAAPRRPGRRGRSLLGRPGRAGAAAPGRVAARPSASPTGSAGSSSAPGSMASRAISRSIRAGCW